MLKNLLKIENIEQTNYRFYLANNYSFFLGMVLHLAFVPLFYYLGTTILMYYNMFSVVLFTAAYILNRKGQHTISTVIASGEMLFHATLAIYIVGWDAGFAYYLLAIIPLLFYNPITTNMQKITLVVIVATFYLGLKYYANTHIAVSPIETEVNNLLYFANSFSLIFIIAALTYYYSLASEINEKIIIQARNQADIANQSKSIFLANMSHELRTPLNAIIGYSEMLYEDEDEQGHEQNASDLKKISNAGNHLLALINNILDLSKIESGKTEFEYQDVNIVQLIDDVVSILTPMAKKENNTLSVNMDKNITVFCIDSTRLKQILFNLLSNACKFTHNGKIEIKVYTERENDKTWMYFCISDTGIGIAKDKLVQLFEPFSQADITTTRLYGGTGLGLTISKHYITLMNGFIEVESELGKGSTFTVRFPSANKNCTANKN